jgi:RNA polymerase sigma-70 factor (ECF subfamily)
MAALASGDRLAWDSVYRRYHRELHLFLLRLCRRRDVADDLAQETWIRLAANASRLRPDTRLWPWLLTVARNVHRSHRRWAMLDVSRVLAFGAEIDRYGLELELEDQTDAKQALRDLEIALGRISVASRELLLLVASPGVEPEDIAQMLGVSSEALRQRLSRARRELSEVLARRAKMRSPT